ncbi:MAG: hypothetical protein EXS15_07375 [Phycisphaerales bacterium]|nr:hypothetical protein [Phycisphaerales bacterium]
MRSLINQIRAVSLTTVSIAMSRAMFLTAALCFSAASEASVPSTESVEPTAPLATSATVMQSKSAPTEKQLNDLFLVGPSVLQSLGLRTVWQSSIVRHADASTTHVFAADGDSVFVMDSEMQLTRVLSRDGRSVWRSTCGRKTDKVLGVNRVSVGKLDEVCVTLDVAIRGVDAVTGDLRIMQNLTVTPASAPVSTGQYLVFASKGGQVAWQQVPLGVFWRANELKGVITSAPLLIGRSVAVASNSGQVAVLNAEDARQIWRKELRGSIDGRLGAGADAVYAACEDHSISALELETGRLRWRHLAGEPLTGDVFCDDELVYTQSPSGGLLALVAKPDIDGTTFQRDGILKWTSTAQGTPICRVGSLLLLWDANAHTLTAVESSNGTIVSCAALPLVSAIALTGPIDPDIYLLCTDGTLQRCESIDRATASARETASRARPASTEPTMAAP